VPTKRSRAKTLGVPADVAAIRKAIKEFLDRRDERNRVIGKAACGVYAFYDYDAEPIYVGQTYEGLRQRIGRHLTNQRTDAVAMNVLDPFEVCDIEVWPLYWSEGGKIPADEKAKLAATEYTIYRKVLKESRFHAVLNEKDVKRAKLVELPPSHRGSIAPDEIYESRRHPDIRIARRASTISNLARVISERDVSPGLRRTLVTQAKRLEWLAERRLQQMHGTYPIEEPGEETGDDE
jgi:hypothetical protein